MRSSRRTKIALITDDTVVVGIDVAKRNHVARCVDRRGITLCKPFRFHNTSDGLESLTRSIDRVRQEHRLNRVVVAMEPTGHYWKAIAHRLKQMGYTVLNVNPYHVHQSKELDDNSPTKNDAKDTGVISALVTQGRFVQPNLPEGVYADLRNLVTARDQLRDKMHRVEMLVQQLLDQYFPEFQSVMKTWDSKTGWTTLRECPFPCDIVKIGSQGLYDKWSQAGHQRAGLKRAEALYEAAASSIGLTEGIMSAELKLDCLLDEMELLKSQRNRLESKMAELIATTPYGDALMSIPALGVVTVATLLSEAGDLSNYASWRQLQKLAGLNLTENSSGQHKGKCRISKRGRSALRSLLYQSALRMIIHSPEFKALHEYFTKRSERPLAGKQSVVALSLKLLRIIFYIARRNDRYDASKVLGEYRKEQLAAA